MASKILSSIMMTFVLFAFVLSPFLQTSEAARFTIVQEVLATRLICPACVCCEPPPHGSCCRCCATSSPIAIQSNNGSP
ncbi:hypothetical protein BUALT_Bualt07G0152600 [Buddleja alternifolia]|uniref:Transmembrane protein n=1 Tax=Buddleja alternifolia TaxID=168488 RepID=A0AAV6XIQ3_9LAMI|nr:hypothetical protein BUALT_Bualt07G0152600 [Buddleja alternifolia]